MGFGLFKKLKEAYKKGKLWLTKAIPKAREIINNVMPILKEAPKITTNPKVKNFFETVDDGLELTDDIINKKKSINDGINWINHNIAPRIKKL